MLSELPDELLLQIVQYLTPLDYNDEEEGPPQGVSRRDQGSLSSLCLTCKRLNTIVIPFLYETFIKADSICPYTYPHLYNEPNDQSDEIERERLLPANHKLRCFLRTLIWRPDLALMVKYLFLTPWANSHWFAHFGYRPTPPTEGLAQMFCTAASGGMMFPRERESWLTALRDGVEDAEVALLLHLLRGLSQLDITMPVWRRSVSRPKLKPEFFFRSLLNTASVRRSKGVSSFAHLERVVLSCMMIGHGAPRRLVSMDVICDLLSLPSLREFEVWYTLGLTPSPGYRAPSEMSSAESIVLAHCLPTEYAVKTLMKSCRRLRNFQMIGDNNFTALERPILDWRLFSDALRIQSGSLQILGLEVNDVVHIETDTLSTRTVASLQGFASLKILRISQWILLGRTLAHGDTPSVQLGDALPSALEELTVVDCDHVILVHLHGLVQNVPSSSSELTKVRTEHIPHLIDESTTRELMDTVTALRDSLMRVGVLWEYG